MDFLWIWLAFFLGLLGSHNDINVLERSSVFALLSKGRAPPVKFSINGNDYTMGWYISNNSISKRQQANTFCKISRVSKKGC